MNTIEFVIAFFSLLSSYFISYWIVGKYDFLHLPLFTILYFTFLIVLIFYYNNFFRPCKRIILEYPKIRLKRLK